MDRYILDGQYGKYLGMIGVRVGEALKAAGVPEDLFSRKKPVLDEAAYYRFMDAVGSQITDPELPIMIASADNIESFSPPIFASYCSKNGRACLERLAAHKRIIAPMRYVITQADGKTKLVIESSREELTMPWFLVETEMVFVIHIIRTATKQDIRPLRSVCSSLSPMKPSPLLPDAKSSRARRIPSFSQMRTWKGLLSVITKTCGSSLNRS